VTALNLLVVVLLTCGAVLSVSYLAMMMLNQDIDGAEQ